MEFASFLVVGFGLGKHQLIQTKRVTTNLAFVWVCIYDWDKSLDVNKLLNMNQLLHSSYSVKLINIHQAV